MYPAVNRTAILIKPKKPFIDWAKYVNDNEKISDRAVEKEFDKYTNTYLLKEIGDDAELEKRVRERFQTIFDNELSGWSQDESEWPQKRDYKTFKEWFEIIDSVMVYDTDTSILERDYES